MVCESEKPSCERQATWRVFWPGVGPVLMCDEHRGWALRIADAMGFRLHTETYEEE